MRVFDDDGTELVQCRQCINGRWETECCNGADGCDCRGQVVDMGACNVCKGIGWHRPTADTRANIRTTEGRCFRGYWAGR